MDYLDSVNDKRKGLQERQLQEFLHKQKIAVSKETAKEIVDAINEESTKTRSVKVENDIATKDDIQEVIEQLKENQLAQLMGNNKPSLVLASGVDVEDILEPLAEKIDSALKTLAENNKDEKVAKQLDKSFGDFAESLAAFMVQNQDALTESVNKIEQTVGDLDLKPVVNVPEPVVNVSAPKVDLSPLNKKLDALAAAIQAIPTPTLDTTEMTIAVDSVRSAIENMRFPVPNYVLPFKDQEGAATQVQLTANGELPVKLDGTIDIGDVNLLNTNGFQINPATEERQFQIEQAISNIVIPIDTFSDLVSNTRYNQIENDFATDPDTISTITVTKTNGGDATSANGQATFSTSTNATGAIKAVTNNVVTYRPHAETYAAFTAIFTTGVANSNQRIGLFDDNDGFFIGYQGTTFGITKRTSGVDTFVAQADFNQDQLLGGETSQFIYNGSPQALDQTKDNLYRIRFGWLGAANIYFDIYGPNGKWVTFHIWAIANQQAVPSIANPNLPLRVEAVKTSGASNITIKTACWAAGTTSNFNKVTDTITDDTLAGLVRSVITGQTTGGGGGYVNVKVNPSGALAVENTPATSSTGTITTASVTNTNTTVLASNGSRKGATIYNEGSVDCYVKLGSTASATSYTIKMATDGYYEVPFGYTGIITGITASGTATLRVSELT